MTHSHAGAGLAIDVFADVVCPWCYIGERRLSRALVQRPNLAVARRWRPFQLQPDMPASGIPWLAFVRSKFGGMERARPIFDRVTAVGESVGLAFDFDRIANSPNTLHAHRVILLASEQGDEWPLVERLFRAHFADGLDIGDVDILVELGHGVGLDPDDVRRYLASDRNRDAVIDSQHTAGRLGISGVPFFVFGARYGVSGAQPEEILVHAIDRATEDAGSTTA